MHLMKKGLYFRNWSCSFILLMVYQEVFYIFIYSTFCYIKGRTKISKQMVFNILFELQTFSGNWIQLEMNEMIYKRGKLKFKKIERFSCRNFIKISPHRYKSVKQKIPNQLYFFDKLRINILIWCLKKCQQCQH